MGIVEAGEEHAEALAALVAELGFEISVPEAEARRSELAAAGCPVLVAVEGGETLGCVSWSLMRVLHRPGPVGRISMLVVGERARGQGLGRALVAAVEQRCAALGCVLVEVTSNTRLEKAHAFYEGLGYERTSFRFAKSPAG